MKHAGAEAEKFCSAPAAACKAALIYGEDPGVVDDAARALINAWTPDGGDIETLDEDTVRREPVRLFDALEARSLLGDERIVRVTTNGDKVAALIGEALALNDEDPDRFGARFVVVAGALQKKSKLRKAFEDARSAAALQFFSDDQASLQALARKRLHEDGLEIDDDALVALVGALPGHRALAATEIEKVAIFGRGLERPIGLSDVRALGAADTDAALGGAVVAALDGDAPSAAAELQKLEDASISPISLLRALHREVSRLHEAQLLGGGDVGMNLKPPVFRSQWPAFSARLSKWPRRRLARILERLYDAEQQAKFASGLGWPLVRSLFMDLARAAR